MSTVVLWPVETAKKPKASPTSSEDVTHCFTDNPVCPFFCWYRLLPVGQPVDMLILEDGSLLVSEDRVGATCRTTDDRYPAEPADQK
jgi:hypothetical protein